LGSYQVPSSKAEIEPAKWHGVENSPYPSQGADLTETLMEWLELLHALLGGNPDAFNNPELTLEGGMSIVEQQYLKFGVPPTLTLEDRELAAASIRTLRDLVAQPLTVDPDRAERFTRVLRLMWTDFGFDPEQF
jgi:hypothetical protein